jgi:hypothetical protein
MPEEGGEEGMEKTLAEALKRIKEAKKKLSAAQEKIDVYDDEENEINEKDFEMLRKGKKQEAVEKPMNEGLKGKPISAWIKDFMDSKNPKFEGKSKKKRREMAIAAFLEYERSQGKDSSVTYVKGKKSKGKKSLKEGSDYGMEEDYMAEDNFKFDEGKKENDLLLDYMPEGDVYEAYMMSEEDIYEDYMNEVRAVGEEDDYSLYEGDDFTFEMDYSQKKK